MFCFIAEQSMSHKIWGFIRACSQGAYGTMATPNF